jgi:hypothetical protein
VNVDFKLNEKAILHNRLSFKRLVVVVVVVFVVVVVVAENVKSNLIL